MRSTATTGRRCSTSTAHCGLTWLRLNLVATVDGNAAGPDGTSESITSRTDRRILGVIRELADVVLIGAASVRAEGYQVPKRAHLAIVTRSGELGGHRLADVDRVVVLGPESARARVAQTLGAMFIAVGDAPGELVTALRDRGLASRSCARAGRPSLPSWCRGAGRRVLPDDVAAARRRGTPLARRRRAPDRARAAHCSSPTTTARCSPAGWFVARPAPSANRRSRRSSAGGRSSTVACAARPRTPRR